MFLLTLTVRSVQWLSLYTFVQRVRCMRFNPMCVLLAVKLGGFTGLGCDRATHLIPMGSCTSMLNDLNHFCLDGEFYVRSVIKCLTCPRLGRGRGRSFSLSQRSESPTIPSTFIWMLAVEQLLFICSYLLCNAQLGSAGLWMFRFRHIQMAVQNVGTCFVTLEGSVPHMDVRWFGTDGMQPGLSRACDNSTCHFHLARSDEGHQSPSWRCSL